MHWSKLFLSEGPRALVLEWVMFVLLFFSACFHDSFPFPHSFLFVFCLFFPDEKSQVPSPPFWACAAGPAHGSGDSAALQAGAAAKRGTEDAQCGASASVSGHSFRWKQDLVRSSFRTGPLSPLWLNTAHKSQQMLAALHSSQALFAALFSVPPATQSPSSWHFSIRALLFSEAGEVQD